MAYPDLYQDEQKLLEAQNIKVKSVSFNAVLTSRRLVLIDSKRQKLPPQEILLATVRSVESGENAIRDPTITLSIITNTGKTRQMIMTFSKYSGGERKRESDEWIRALRQHLLPTIEHPVVHAPPPPVEDFLPEEPVPVAPPASSPPPRIEIVNAPPQKKRIEISRPIKKIVEAPPAMPAPVETTSLPVGSFCNRCGSRVPPESVFCNRCGTPVTGDSDYEDLLSDPEPETSPIPQVAIPSFEPEVPAANTVQAYEQPAVPYFDEPAPAVQPAAAPVPQVPQVAVPVPPVFGTNADKKERPIEDVIHSIEPLIEDSVPRTVPAPLVPRTMPAPVPEPAPAEPAPAAAEPSVQWPVISPGAPAAPAPDAGATAPAAVPPVKKSRKKIVLAAVAAVIILAVLGAVVLMGNPLQAIGGGATTPEPTEIPTTVTTPATMPPTTTTPARTVATPEPADTTPAPVKMLVPTSGVWVHIKYQNEFSGTVGTPNALRDVSATGEQFYQVPTSTGTVSASITKVDGSGDLLTVEIYKDGKLVTDKSTTAPMGTVEIQVSLKPETTTKPTTVQTTAAVQKNVSAGSKS